jgi:hypothetical protein
MLNINSVREVLEEDSYELTEKYLNRKWVPVIKKLMNKYNTETGNNFIKIEDSMGVFFFNINGKSYNEDDISEETNEMYHPILKNIFEILMEIESVFAHFYLNVSI